MFDIDIDYYDEVTSTNEILRQMALEGAKPGKTVVAWKQSAGRGRLGRTFQSPRGGIYLSMLLPMEGTMTLTARAAVAVKRAIEEVTDKKVQIKWVNDILYKGKKVAGILAQGIDDKVVLGIGINFNTDIKALGPELKDSACSLYNSWEEPDSDSMDLVNSLVRHMYELAGNIGQQGPETSWLNEYRGASAVIGKKVRVFQAGRPTGSGLVTEIDDNCALHVLDEKKGEMILSTGEITIRLD